MDAISPIMGFFRRKEIKPNYTLNNHSRIQTETLSEQMYSVAYYCTFLKEQNWKNPSLQNTDSSDPTNSIL